MTGGPKPLPEQNAKGELIAACRSLGLPDPTFATESGGPGHAPWFRCTVTVSGVAGEERGLGEGKSRREAERLASLDVLRALGVLERPGAPEPAGHVGQARAVSPAPVPVRWPIYADVLREALLVAHERNDHGTLPQVAQEAAQLYRALMSELGHTPQEDQA